jgi:NAD-dependent dihydropyrimidine dehydrogenase PreA subunit
MDIKKNLVEEWRNVRDLRYLEIVFDSSRCKGIWQCYEVCPMGRWTPDYKLRIAILDNERYCIACGACVLQCPEDAIQLIVPVR